MRTDDDVYFPGFQIFFDGIDFFGRPQTGDKFNATRKIFQTGSKGVVMLQTKNRGRNQYSHLFAVTNGFEGGPNGNFRFSEAYIPTDEPIHRTSIFHVTLDGPDRFILIGGIFVYKGRFQLFLKIIVGRKGKTARSFPFSIEPDKVFCNILDLVFGRHFGSRPGFAA